MAEPAPAQPPLITRDFVLLVIAHFLQGLGFSSMLLLPLFPSMPGIITALLDAFVLVFILFLIFWPQLKKEMTFLFWKLNNYT